MRRRTDIWTFAQIGIWLVVLVLLIWPLSSAVRASLANTDGTGFTLANYARVLTLPRHLRAIRNTLIAGFGGMFGAVVLGSTLAYLLTRYRLRGEMTLRTLAVLALVSPPFIGAYAWIVLFGANGVVRHWLEDFGIAAAVAVRGGRRHRGVQLQVLPNVFLFVATALAQVNRSLEEAAEGTRAVTRPPFPESDPADGDAVAVGRGGAGLRAVDRRFRHAAPDRAGFRCAGDPGLHALHGRTGRQSRRRLLAQHGAGGHFGAAGHRPAPAAATRRLSWQRAAAALSGAPARMARG